MTDAAKPWWQKIEWTDILVVGLGILLLLLVTAELWLPHFGPD